MAFFLFVLLNILFLFYVPKEEKRHAKPFRQWSVHKYIRMYILCLRSTKNVNKTAQNFGLFSLTKPSDVIFVESMNKPWTTFLFTIQTRFRKFVNINKFPFISVFKTYVSYNNVIANGGRLRPWTERKLYIFILLLSHDLYSGLCFRGIRLLQPRKEINLFLC